jgi:RNA-directed DNA polymerase
MGMERRGCVDRLYWMVNQEWEEPLNKARPFGISKQVVWEAYQRIKANEGAAGMDGESIAEFERDRSNNLYKLWNRMSSGSYFPPPVRTVEIPKSDGGKRALGIPTVTDRIAQMVVKMYLEPLVEPHFHQDSFGYRPGKSAIQAVGLARQRCWRNDWVLDLDIKGFFDNLDHALLMRAVRKHTECRWIILYIERWLKAPAKLPDGTLMAREQGTPQGGVISPLLANLFLHYAFDVWMRRHYPTIPFERYADDIVVHSKSERQALWLKTIVARRLAQCKLELHSEKTKIVYCKDSDRTDSYPNVSFDFLGFGFRPRGAKSRLGRVFVSFLPAVSKKAVNSMRRVIRGWRLHRLSDKNLLDLSRMFNPVIRGWITYYGSYYKSALYSLVDQLNRSLKSWAMRKYKRLRGHPRKAAHWLWRIKRQQPTLFSHWQLASNLVADR